jgi:para-nitrobenzyl esterase
VGRDNYTAVLSADFPSLLVRLLAPSPGADDASARTRAASFEGDMRFRWDMWTWARLAATAGTHRVYLYEFTRNPPFSRGSRYFGMGPTHGMEMPYVFGHLDPEAASWSDADLRLSDTMQAYWTRFATSGDPNQTGMPVWSDWRSSPGKIMSLGTEIRMASLSDPQSLEKIDRLYLAVRNIAAHPLLVLSLTLTALIAVAAGAYAVLRRGWVRAPRRRPRQTRPSGPAHDRGTATAGSVQPQDR